MQFRTEIHTAPSPFRIGYADPVMFAGSCFAAEIGSKMLDGRMQVMINPAGTIFNPVSVAVMLQNVINAYQASKDDLFSYGERWISFSHYTGFSGSDSEEVLDRINKSTAEAHHFLKNATALFITFGTARVFRLKQTGMIVSNCHKLPDNMFTRELPGVSDVTALWGTLLDELRRFNPRLKVVFTVSPVRHWKDGAHGNQVSKSVLFLAIEELLRHGSSPGYFPAYEILMDELRDYRFYASDMLHPSGMAVDYIFEVFTRCYIDDRTMTTWREAEKIVKASRHQVGEPGPKTSEFASSMLERISKLESSVPGIDFSREKEYFRGLVSK